MIISTGNGSIIIPYLFAISCAHRTAAVDLEKQINLQTLFDANGHEEELMMLIFS